MSVFFFDVVVDSYPFITFGILLSRFLFLYGVDNFKHLIFKFYKYYHLDLFICVLLAQLLALYLISIVNKNIRNILFKKPFLSP